MVGIVGELRVLRSARGDGVRLADDEFTAVWLDPDGKIADGFDDDPKAARAVFLAEKLKDRTTRTDSLRIFTRRPEGAELQAWQDWLNHHGLTPGSVAAPGWIERWPEDRQIIYLGYKQADDGAVLLGEGLGHRVIQLASEPLPFPSPLEIKEVAMGLSSTEGIGELVVDALNGKGKTVLADLQSALVDRLDIHPARINVDLTSTITSTRPSRPRLRLTIELTE